MRRLPQLMPEPAGSPGEGDTSVLVGTGWASCTEDPDQGIVWQGERRGGNGSKPTGDCLVGKSPRAALL